MKKFATLSFVIIFAVLALSIAVFGCTFVINTDTEIAYADSASDGEYFKVAVSDLAGNDYAQISDIKVSSTAIPFEEYLFFLPESFYLKKIAETSVFGNQLVYIEYAGATNSNSGISGEQWFITKSDFDKLVPAESTLDTSSSSLNPLLTIAETETINLDGTPITKDSGYTVRYVGSYFDTTDTTRENEFLYVSIEKDGTKLFATVEKSKFNAFNKPYHSITQTAKDALTAETTAPSGDGSSNENAGGIDSAEPGTSGPETLRIVLIIGIVLPAVAIVLLLFKPNKKQTNYDKRTIKKQRSNSKSDYDNDMSRGRHDNYDRSRDYDRYDRRDRDYNRYDRDYDRYRDDRDYQRRDRYDDYDRR